MQIYQIMEINKEKSRMNHSALPRIILFYLFQKLDAYLIEIGQLGYISIYSLYAQ